MRECLLMEQANHRGAAPVLASLSPSLPAIAEGAGSWARRAVHLLSTLWWIRTSQALRSSAQTPTFKKGICLSCRRTVVIALATMPRKQGTRGTAKCTLQNPGGHAFQSNLHPCLPCPARTFSLFPNTMLYNSTFCSSNLIIANQIIMCMPRKVKYLKSKWWGLLWCCELSLYDRHDLKILSCI